MGYSRDNHGIAMGFVVDCYIKDYSKSLGYSGDDNVDELNENLPVIHGKSSPNGRMIRATSII